MTSYHSFSKLKDALLGLYAIRKEKIFISRGNFVKNLGWKKQCQYKMYVKLTYKMRVN